VQVRGIFVLPPTSFFWLEIKWDHMLQQGWDFCLHIGWKKMGKQPEKFQHGRENSDIVGKIPTWSENFPAWQACTTTVFVVPARQNPSL
jgi:hypothetical protein